MILYLSVHSAQILPFTLHEAIATADSLCIERALVATQSHHPNTEITLYFWKIEDYPSFLLCHANNASRISSLQCYTHEILNRTKAGRGAFEISTIEAVNAHRGKTIHISKSS